MPNAGLGVFTTQRIPQGTEKVTSLIGMDVSCKFPILSKWPWQHSHQISLIRFVCSRDGIQVPQPDRGVGSFINSTHHPVYANVKFVKAHTGLNFTVNVVAIRDINPGDELLAFYGGNH